MNPAILLKKPIVLLVIALFILMIFLPFVSTGSLFDDFTTDGEAWSMRGYTFLPLIDTPTIQGNWRDGQYSETFTITSSVWKSSVSLASVMKYRYALYVDGTSVPAKRFPTDGAWITPPATISTGAVQLQPWTTSIASTGTLRIKVVLETIINDWDGDHTYSDPENLGWDGAYVKSGRGEIYLPANQLGPFEEGSNVNIYVRTGYTGGQGWSVKIYPPLDRTDLNQQGTIIKNLADDTQTYVGWTVPAGAFKAGSSNAWIAELWNAYFDVGWEQVLTIDSLERAPIITGITEINNGNSMTYTVSMERTYSDLSHVTVYAWYGTQTMPSTADTQSWIIYGQNYPVAGTAATFTVNSKTGIDGNVMVKIVAYDIDGRPSTPDYKAFVDDNDVVDPVEPPLEQPFIWTTAAIITAALVVIGIIAILAVAPQPMEIKLILVIILGIAGAIFVWMFGTLQWGV